ncbi:Neprilysin-21, partial [Orchesella cincta]
LTDFLLPTSTMFRDNGETVNGAENTPKVTPELPAPIDFRQDQNLQVDDETLRDIFPPRHHDNSLGSLQSFIMFRRGGSHESIENLTQIYKRHSLDAQSGEANLRRRHHAAKPFKRAGRNRYEFAGIAHSDLDIQISRPPLMYQMNILEWLWLQSTIGHRVILMLVGVLFTLFLLHLAFWIHLSLPADGDHHVCKTKPCRNLARRLSSSIDSKVNPCENFYAFACGTSGGISTAEEDKWYIGTDSNRISYNFDSSISLGTMLKKTEEFPDHLVLDMYKACLHEKARQSSGLGPFYDLLKKLNLYSFTNDSPLTTLDVVRAWQEFSLMGYLHPQFRNRHCEHSIHSPLWLSIVLQNCEGSNIAFDYNKLVARLYELTNPGKNASAASLYPDTKTDPRSDKHFLTYKFENLMNISAPVRISKIKIINTIKFYKDKNTYSAYCHIVRYLQWRVLNALALELTDEVRDIMININRHRYRGRIANCFHCLFTWLPFVAPDRFLNQVPDATISKQVENFNRMANQVQTAYKRMIQRVSFSGNKDNEKLSRAIVLARVRFEMVPPVLFSRINFPIYSQLFNGISLNEETHLENLLKMGQRIFQWKAGSNYTSIFYKIDDVYRTPVLIDKNQVQKYLQVENRTNVEKYRIYLPLGSIEPPFFNEGLFVADTSGLGLLFTGTLQERTVLSFAAAENNTREEIEYLTNDPGVQKVLKELNLDESESELRVGKILNEIKGFTFIKLGTLYFQSHTWKDSGKTWNNFYPFEKEGILKLLNIMLEQNRLHIVSTMVNEYLATHVHESKLRLQHLEQYDAKQLFYLTHANRLCEKVSVSELEHRYKFGPFLQSVTTNIAFSNLNDFGKAFNCPVGSPMNRQHKPCRNLARRLSSSIDSKVNPCQNFYAYACGTSGGISTAEEDKWYIGTDSNRISYNFDSSISLGTMLKKTEEFPDHLVLDMYKACLHEKARQSSGLGPFYDLLKRLNLYSFTHNTSLTTLDVIESMARILAHGLSSSAIVNVDYYINESSNYTDKRASYVITAETDVVNSASIHRYGYKLYYETVKAAFEHLTELKIGHADIETIAHDIVCLEAYLRDNLEPKKLAGVTKPCQINGGVIDANFNQPLIADFDLNLLVARLYELANPGLNASDASLYPNTKSDPRSDDFFLKNRFKHLMETSAPVRIMRYLQWRVLNALALELTDEVRDIMIDINRHRYRGRIANCIHCLFTWLPFVAPDRFLNQVPDATISKQVENFNRMANQVQTAYKSMIQRESFSEYMSADSAITKENVNLLRAMLLAQVSFEMVPPVLFSRDNFPIYSQLFDEISLNEEDHLENLLKMGQRIFQWKAGSNYTSIFYKIDDIYRTTVLIDKNQVQQNLQELTTSGGKKYRIYLPLGSVEPPFFNEGLFVADTSGLGLLFTGALQERTVFLFATKKKFGSDSKEVQYFINEPGVQKVLKEMNLTESMSKEQVRKLLVAIRNLTSRRLIALHNQTDTWVDSGKTWNNFNPETTEGTLKLLTIMLEQSRLHIVSTMVDEYLASNVHESKLRLPHLEHYDAKQLFYLTHVNRLCEKVSVSELEHRYNFGPLLQSITTNIAFSNLDDFGKTFNCSVGSPMNREIKVTYWSKA